jgi:hypothetical protein
VPDGVAWLWQAASMSIKRTETISARLTIERLFSDW